ncbi:hypothetical protein SKAU_G00141570 [Synaphobranchus kaupii]|uniref:Uncharacterized protein n=1 Tax=Synaphobranchus kaupii TaxID=118154 RepID=A0A9Q1FSY5_SYNKA|nr:hypothetical protein SKAU_G00141570 [Synaphobranchus kaupii]
MICLSSMGFGRIVRSVCHSLSLRAAARLSVSCCSANILAPARTRCLSRESRGRITQEVLSKKKQGRIKEQGADLPPPHLPWGLTLRRGWAYPCYSPLSGVRLRRGWAYPCYSPAEQHAITV